MLAKEASITLALHHKHSLDGPSSMSILSWTTPELDDDDDVGHAVCQSVSNAC